MSEYIKREDVENIMLSSWGESALWKIRYLPPADVVEIVRCRDCKWWRDDSRMIDLPKDKLIAPCNINERDSYEDDYCSYGERKDGESHE